MDLMLLLLAVVAFPAACLTFVLWMGVIEDSLPAGVARALREPDPPPILVVPVRRTAVEVAGWWESVARDGSPALVAGQAPAPDAIPGQRTPTGSPAVAAATPATSALPALPGLPAAAGPLAGT